MYATTKSIVKERCMNLGTGFYAVTLASGPSMSNPQVATVVVYQNDFDSVVVVAFFVTAAGLTHGVSLDQTTTLEGNDDHHETQVPIGI